jgi:hypothetical protein
MSLLGKFAERGADRGVCRHPGDDEGNRPATLDYRQRTVECHRASIMQKLEVANIVEPTRLVALSG